MRLRSVALWLATFAAGLVAQDNPGQAPLRLRQVLVTTSDVFSAESVEQMPIRAVVNAVHWQTRESVIRREVWMVPGEIVTVAQAEELERNLRRLGLFAEVAVRLVSVGDGQHADLEIVTRDRLSLLFSASASRVGGVTGFRASIGESNVLGFGDRVAASFTRNSEGDFRGSVAYTDLHVLDTWHVADLRASRSEDGDSFGFGLRRPFKHLADPRGYGVAVNREAFGAEYFRDGEDLAEVPVRANTLSGNMTWASGSELQRRYRGFVLWLDDRDYGTARGPLGPSIRVPGATQSVFAGLQTRWEWIDGFRKVEGLDTIDYLQDLTLGLFVGATLGARWRDEQGLGGDLQPELSVSGRWSDEPLQEVFVDLTARASGRFDGERSAAWSHSLGAWAFALTGEGNAIGGNVTYDAVAERQDLPVELVLGEDRGLRGYAANQLNGNARLLVNLEDRFDTGLEFATLHLGAVVFFDAGWVGSDGDLGRPYESAGVGLRIGSKALLGDGVFRVDLAKPLDQVVGESDGWKLSISMGQVITFGGNVR